MEKLRARTYPQWLISVLVRNNHNNHPKHRLDLLHKLSIYSILVDLLTFIDFQKELSLAIIHLLRWANHWTFQVLKKKNQFYHLKCLASKHLSELQNWRHFCSNIFEQKLSSIWLCLIRKIGFMWMDWPVLPKFHGL